MLPLEELRTASVVSIVVCPLYVCTPVVFIVPPFMLIVLAFAERLVRLFVEPTLSAKVILFAEVPVVAPSSTKSLSPFIVEINSILPDV